MNQLSKPQHARVEQPFGIEPPLVHCPICGSPSMEMDDSEGPMPVQCGHLAFIYVGAIGEFVHESEDFADRMEKSANLELEFDLDGFSSDMQQLGYSNKLLALQVTYGGMACGPVWYTDIYGYDYESLAQH